MHRASVTADETVASGFAWMQQTESLEGAAVR
jgi:hypothetical protein